MRMNSPTCRLAVTAVACILAALLLVALGPAYCGEAQLARLRTIRVECDVSALPNSPAWVRASAYEVEYTALVSGARGVVRVGAALASETSAQRRLDLKIPARASSAYLALCVEGPGGTSRTWRLLTPVQRPTTELDSAVAIALLPSVLLRGRVTSPEGKAVAESWIVSSELSSRDRGDSYIVEYENDAWGGQSTLPMWPAISTATDPQGEFVAGPVPLGTNHWVRAFAVGHFASRSTELAAERRGGSATIALRELATIKLRIVGTVAAAPLAGVVSAVEESGAVHAVEVLRLPSTLVLSSVSSSEVVVSVDVPGYGRRRVVIACIPGSVVEHQLSLAPEVIAIGRVLGRGGVPAGGVRIITVACADGASSEADTDDGGEFVLRGLATGPHRIDVLLGTARIALGQHLLPAQDLQFQLPPLGSVRIQLTRAVGAMDKRARVAAVWLSGPASGAQRLPMLPGESRVVGWKDLPAGTYELGVHLLGGGRVALPVVVLSGDEVDVGHFDLDDIGEGLR